MMNARVLSLCIVAALGACHKDSAAPPAVKAAPRANAAVVIKPGPSAAELTAGMVEAATQGKSQLPVELKFDLSQRPTVGQPLELAIAIVPQIPAGPADIQITSADGLDVAPDAKQADIPSVEPGEVYRQSIKLTPSAEGVQFLGLTVSLKHDEITESRVFSIPLIVASGVETAAPPR